jgi:hypothetical protein
MPLVTGELFSKIPGPSLTYDPIFYLLFFLGPGLRIKVKNPH